MSYLRYLLNEELVEIYSEVRDFSRKLCTDIFEALILTILSQNTSSINMWRAFNELKRRIGCTPQDLYRARIKDIEDAIRIAGMYRIRSRKIKLLVKKIVEEYNGDLSFLKDMPLEKARALLLSLPGVGYKTADIILLFCFNKHVFPIDTHIFRISRRLGLIDQKDGYEVLRRKLEEIIKPENYKLVHLALIQHGRKICKPQNPLCEHCIFRNVCPYSMSSRK